MLGAGVYVTRDIRKASKYPLDVPDSEKRVLKVRVDVGKVKIIDKQGHPMQKTWHTVHGFDTAWVPPNVGMVLCNQEDDCVYDPKRIKVIEVMKNTRDSAEFYQLCCVDINGTVRGASTPFCFKTPGEQSTDYSLESNLLMQLLELRRIIEEKENIAEMAKVENEELSRENQDLKRDIERLRKEFAALQAAPVSMEHPSPYGSPTDPTPTEEQQQDVLSDCLPSGDHYETPGNPNSPADELELHEDSHRVRPFCTLICNGMELTIFEDHVFSQEAFAALQAAPVSMEHPSPYVSPTDPTPTEEQQQDVLSDCLPSGDHYETPGNPNSPACRHCHEWFPGITQDELELHEDSHRVCPFCTLICDGMEHAIFEDHVFSH
ncbi:unnamed protein product [Coregonus sp. 'balchen']|nr:unnamed protein product [Coregonus sp. 'balchen']